MTAAADPLLEVTGLSKRYCHDLRRSLAYGVADIAREFWPFAAAPRLRRDEFWAIRDVSFDLRRGEALAIVGGNGAGKSTLLRMLLGLLKPDGGEVRIRGRLEAILDLGAGLHEALSGRENLHLRAALLGEDRRGADDFVERAIAFAELGSFVDDAVQSYSTGMRARLAYAAAAQLRPDILLIDEALAVGDFAFQRKCIGHMRTFVRGGGALILVSHNSHQVQAVCGRGLLLEKGEVVLTGSAAEALSAMYDRPLVGGGTAAPQATSGPVRLTALSVAGSPALATGGPAEILLDYHTDRAIEATWGFGIWTDDRERCVTGASAPVARMLPPGTGTLRCHIPRLPLIAGRYRLDAALLDPETHLPLAQIGHLGGGIPLHVPARADMRVHRQIRLGQLTEMDVVWPGDRA